MNNVCLSELDEKQKSQLEYELINRLAAYALPSITKIDLYITEKCTLNCDYCFVDNKKPLTASWNVIRKGIDFLMQQSRDSPTVTIVFFGGEPLMEFELMKATANYASISATNLGKKPEYAVTTNGTIMSEEIALFGRRYGFNYLLSIDPGKAAHDLHRKTKDGRSSWDIVTGTNFDILKSIQGWMGARLTVNPDTVRYLSDGVEALFERGVNQFLIGLNLDVDWLPEELETLTIEWRKIVSFYIKARSQGAPLRIIELEDTPDQREHLHCNSWGCSAGRTQMAISIYGDLYPCAKFVSSYSLAEKYRLGDVENGVKSIESRMELLGQKDELRPDCAICSVCDACSGGCFAINQRRCGSIYKPCPEQCFLTRLYNELATIVHRASIG